MRFEDVIGLLKAFDDEGVRYALVGSMGMAAHGLVRATHDIDLMLASDPTNVERAKRALRAVYGDPQIEEITSDDLAGPYPVIRFAPEGTDLVIDLIARLGSAFEFDDIEAEDLLVEGVRVRVATKRMLYEMKRHTVRPQDRADAEALQRRFGVGERDEP